MWSANGVQRQTAHRTPGARDHKENAKIAKPQARNQKSRITETSKKQYHNMYKLGKLVVDNVATAPHPNIERGRTTRTTGEKSSRKQTQRGEFEPQQMEKIRRKIERNQSKSRTTGTSSMK